MNEISGIVFEGFIDRAKNEPANINSFSCKNQLFIIFRKLMLTLFLFIHFLAFDVQSILLLPVQES